MNAGPLHRLPRIGKLPGLSARWKQALVLSALVLFVLATMFPADSREFAPGRPVGLSWVTPCDLVDCEQNKAVRGEREAEMPGESPGDSVRYRDGVGFVIPVGPKQHPDSPGLSKPF